jgi:hypothetical protein
MPSAFVLISAELGSEAEVLKKLKKIEGVEEAFTVYGVRDIIAKVDAETMDELKTIVRRIERTDKVKSTRVVLKVGSIIQNAETDRKMESPYFAAMYCSKHGWIKFEDIDMRLNPKPLFLCPKCQNKLRVGPRQNGRRRVWREKKLWETRDKLIKKLLSRTVENGGLHRV